MLDNGHIIGEKLPDSLFHGTHILETDRNSSASLNACSWDLWSGEEVWGFEQRAQARQSPEVGRGVMCPRREAGCRGERSQRYKIRDVRKETLRPC